LKVQKCKLKIDEKLLENILAGGEDVVDGDG
jgi:hypothetical protein